jgi:uncharacterized damage-inducible protein DinB
MKSLCNANIVVLDQLSELIDRCQNIYLKQEGSAHAGIGQHVRHVLDHYKAFQSGLSLLCVDYNQRHRNGLEETRPEVALSQVSNLKQWLRELDITNQNVDVISEINVRVTESQAMQSNIERELLYLINHSIHHMAYASLLASQLGTSLPHHIGLAPGTATYERAEAAHA